ncbi:hypothetical protein EC988_003653, partial [Linderina pennispora]
RYAGAVHAHRRGLPSGIQHHIAELVRGDAHLPAADSARKGPRLLPHAHLRQQVRSRVRAPGRLAGGPGDGQGLWLPVPGDLGQDKDQRRRGILHTSPRDPSLQQGIRLALWRRRRLRRHERPWRRLRRRPRGQRWRMRLHHPV